jgi:ribonuclease BN (tRNA processing enzyme)
MGEPLVRFIGSGDAFGSGGRFQTCIQLSSAEYRLLLDCGASSLVAMKQSDLEPSAVDGVVLSHLHGDHFGGLPFLVLDGQFSGRSRPLVVAGPPRVLRRLEAAMEVLFPGSSRARRDFSLEVIELAAGMATRLGPAVIRAVEVKHQSGAPSYGIRVELAGRIVAYSGDTAWTEALIDLAEGADLFVCEAYSYDKKVPFHLDYVTLLEHRQRLRCQRLVLTHVGRDMLGHLGQVEDTVATDGLVIEL